MVDHSNNNYSSKNKTIAINTIFLYARTLLLLGLSLYTSRVTLQALGVENYGIINVVSGFVSMFSLLSGSMTSACQRFITYELGNPQGDIRKIFSSSFYIHATLAVIIVLVAESFGIYFINNKLNLPYNRIYEAHWIFQCSIITFVLNLINIPYTALIVAHEKMKSFAYISILEAILKFATVFSLLYLPYNLLVCYALFTLLSSTFVRFVYQYYCMRAFPDECKLKRVIDKGLLKDIFGFAGWAFIGNSATLFSTQGVNMVLNIFLGVTLNAARGIAVQVEGAVTLFLSAFTMAINPQITKSYAKKDYSQLTTLLDMGLRMSFFLIILLSIPIIVAAPDILNIWLGVYPDYTVVFVRITLLSAIVQATANCLMTTIYASGSIKTYQIIVGGLVMLNLPISYLLLKFNFSPIYIYVISLVIYALTFLIRMYYIKVKLNISVRFIWNLIITRFFPIGMLSAICSYSLSIFLNTSSIMGLTSFTVLSIIFMLSIIMIGGVSKSERVLLLNFARNKIRLYVNK